MPKNNLKVTYLLLIFFIILYFVFTSISQKSVNSLDKYNNTLIKGRIEAIIDYNRGKPTVIIDEKKFTLTTTVDCRNYLQIGDSVVKKEKSTRLVVFRDSADFNIITAWSIDSADDKTGRGLSKKFIVRK